MGTFGQGDQAVAAHIQRNAKPAAAGVDKASAELFARGEGDRVDKEVDSTKMGGDLGKEGVDRPVVGHVALFDKGGVDAGGKRLDPFFEDFPSIAEA